MTETIITPELVELDVSPGADPEAVIRRLAGLVAAAGRAGSAEALAADALAREASAGTGVPGGVAIPHCRSETVAEPTLAFARLADPVDFSGPDGPADLVFLIAAPAGAGKAHLKILSKLARALVKPDFRARLRGAGTPADIVDAVAERIAGKPAASPATPAPPRPEPVDAGPATRITRIAAVTACPTGIAHTYMAADSLAQAAADAEGVELTVETQGSSSTAVLDPAVIAAADAVIFATDVGVRDRGRFAGKPVVESGVKRAINEPAAMIAEAVAAAADPGAHRVAADSGAADPAAAEAGGPGGLGWGKRIQQAVMTGVSYMVPFVAAAGLLIALGFLFGDYDVTRVAQAVVADHTLWDLPGHDVAVDGELVTVRREGLALYLGAVLFTTGQAGMGVIVAILSAFIAFGLAGRPGIAPGFIGGAISATIGAGFLGGLVTGIVAGLIALGLASARVPRWLGSLMPVVIIPLLASAGVGLLMFLLLGRPLTSLMEGLESWLGSLSGGSAALLGVIVGLMMCADMGGPINKAAYLFATAGLSTGDAASMRVMAAVMAAGMVPPLAMALASALRPRLFTPAERENGKAGWLLGASFISEGAIPFAAADPLRVIPSMMAGGAVTGALSMAFGAASHAPHGGVFVFFAIDGFGWWLLAIAAGTVVGATAVSLLKHLRPGAAADPGVADATAAAAAPAGAGT
ncbi:PTS lactose transporter subunit IIC [Corynebacterium sphenisci DSM 44792]|uniref:PTS lactose transporter subunit IIC n=1 Tax=Corynebacterium sphenisci DSM 44792 TaxID=1437874 RepID=A0A1L7CXT8_9CORY|nr:fructose-specific PTS transporter subunit EIIC [Corynebacterium sphenisci]APT90617.1 PTS lactose transporter subunit IIC [Corynebacterium sphenisci DSM 44792]